QLPGRKDLFIEADLMSPLDRIANVSILKVRGVRGAGDVLPLLTPRALFCFLVRPRVQTMRYIA
ncbi:Vacuolar protein sorting-associated protein 33B, partial [Acanthisitta chloris]